MNIETIYMVVLAKSRKHKGYCVAGKRLIKYHDGQFGNTGEWIRPVSDLPDMSGALYDHHLISKQGEKVTVGDIVQLTVFQGHGVLPQPENRIITNERWDIICRDIGSDIFNVIEQPESIWLDPRNVRTDRVSPAYVNSNQFEQSLYLIQPNNLELTLENAGNGRKIKASFIYNGVQYSELSVTCPAIYKIFTNQFPAVGMPKREGVKLRKGDNYVLTVSLAPYYAGTGAHHKLVACAFDYDGYLQRTYAA